MTYTVERVSRERCVRLQPAMNTARIRRMAAEVLVNGQLPAIVGQCGNGRLTQCPHRVRRISPRTGTSSASMEAELRIPTYAFKQSRSGFGRPAHSLPTSNRFFTVAAR